MSMQNHIGRMGETSVEAHVNQAPSPVPSVSADRALDHTSHAGDYYWNTNRVEFATVALLILLSFIPFVGFAPAVGLLVLALVKGSRRAMIAAALAIAVAVSMIGLVLSGNLGNIDDLQLQASSMRHIDERGYSYYYPEGLTLTSDDQSGTQFEDLESGTYSYSIYNIDYETSTCLLYTSPSPRDATLSRMPSSA